MYRFLHSRNGGRAALVTAGLLAIASVGSLLTPSRTEARGRLSGAGTGEQPRDGRQIFAATCASCHQASGAGVADKYPPLDGSEWVAGDDAKLVRIVLHGLTGPVEVAGETFAGEMPAWGGVLKDGEIAAVATYIRGAWGNKAAPVTAARVASVRAATASRKIPWTADELSRIAIPITKR